jgi:hypothetical protein
VAKEPNSTKGGYLWVTTSCLLQRCGCFGANCEKLHWDYTSNVEILEW